MKPKHQRLVLALLALVALVGAGLLAAIALRDQAAYFYTPSELAAADVEPGRAIRLGGIVEEGSIKRGEDGVTFDFMVIDGEGGVAVRFRGVPPDLFVEGSGVVAEGRLDESGAFVADTLLAKHDENYVPPPLEGVSEAVEARTAETVER